MMRPAKRGGSARRFGDAGGVWGFLVIYVLLKIIQRQFDINSLEF